MPFDPSQPAPSSPNSSAAMRAQLNALNDKIDTTLPGPQGPQGSQGSQGEVTAAQLSTAIADTGRNPLGVAELIVGISDPPAQGEVQQIVAKLNELIAAVKR